MTGEQQVTEMVTQIESVKVQESNKAEEISSVIAEDQADYFEVFKQEQKNWAFYQYDGVIVTIDVALAHSSENVVEKLLSISMLSDQNIQELTQKYLPQELDAYKKSSEIDKTSGQTVEQPGRRIRRCNIIKSLVNHGANPFDEKTTYFRDICLAGYEALISNALTSNHPLSPERLLTFMKDESLNSKRSLILKHLKTSEGSLDRFTENEELLAILKSDPACAVYLEKADMTIVPLEDEQKSQTEVTKKDVAKPQQSPSCWGSFFKKLNFCGGSKQYKQVEENNNHVEEHDEVSAESLTNS